MGKASLKNRFKKAMEQIRRKRTLAGVLNFGVIAFGHAKKDYFIRLTRKPLAENRVFTVRYIALIDVFILIGIVLWYLQAPYGFDVFVFFIGVAIMVFFDQRDVEKRAKPIKKTIQKVLPIEGVAPEIIKPNLRRKIRKTYNKLKF